MNRHIHIGRLLSTADEIKESADKIKNLIEDYELSQERSEVSSEDLISESSEDDSSSFDLLVSDTLRVELLTDDALIPVRGSEGAAGYDISACEDGIVPAGKSCLVKTGLSFATPAGTYARLAPRSGLASKRGIHVGAGVIDSDYRGEVKVLLLNMSSEDFAFHKGDRIAQAIFEKISLPAVEIVRKGGLDSSVRGSAGFGSTGN